MRRVKSNPPFRAEHIGSLLRPRSLRDAYKDFADGRIGKSIFKATQDRAIREVVALQEETGLQVITDGEFRRQSYWSHFVEAVDGLTVKTARYTFHDESSEREFLAPHVEGKVRRNKPISGDEFDFVRGVSDRTPKITMPSPPTMHFWRGDAGISDKAYNTRQQFFDDLAEVYRSEIADLYARGCRYIQMDDVPLAMLCDTRIQDHVKADGEDWRMLTADYIGLINDCVAGAPDDMTLGLHMCRGNFKGSWLSEGGYQAIAEQLLAETDVDVFFMEYDTERAGGFAPLAYLPDNKKAVLGLVTTKRAELEDADDLKRRIDEAGKYAPLERLGLSPQCGFSSTVAGNPITIDDQRRKLARIVEVAGDVWGSEAG